MRHVRVELGRARPVVLVSMVAVLAGCSSEAGGNGNGSGGNLNGDVVGRPGNGQQQPVGTGTMSQSLQPVGQQQGQQQQQQQQSAASEEVSNALTPGNTIDLGAAGASGASPNPGVAGMTGAAAGVGAAGVGAAGTGGSMMPQAGTAGMGAAGTGGASTPIGPEDGDPNSPVVSTPDVACGGPAGFFGGANFDIGGREMIVTYPCNKHVGAPMTFFLNLHGTTPVEQHFYQHGYFSIHNYAESHNLIVVTPSSVVEQWGNMDGGQDEPHLMAIIDWVYSTFDGPEKFDIRGMWVGGHSWGAMYTTTFVCKDYLADKIKGAMIMSGIGLNPACASSISVISSAAEDDIGPVVNQGSVPAGHGCGAEQTSMIGNNEETLWPDCDPGFVHANYFMLGKSHTSSIDAEVVERIADLIKQARQ